MLAMALYWLNSLELMRVLAVVFLVTTLVLLLVVRSCMHDYAELAERHDNLKFKWGAAQRKISELAAERDKARMQAASMVDAAKFRQVAEQNKRQVSANENGPVTVINNFAQSKERPMNFPKDLDEVQESLKNGGRLMSKMRKNKSLIKEVGFLRAVMMFGLLYVLASMIRESWERIKYRFEEEDAKPGKNDPKPGKPEGEQDWD